MNPLSKTPFLFLLTALVAGILLQYYGCNILWCAIVFPVGGTIVLFSYLVKREKQYSLRWLFGLGVFFLFVAVGAFRTYQKQESLNFSLDDSVQTYVGYVTDTPQDKPQSVACKIHLKRENANVVCYLQKDSAKKPPEVGDEIIFYANLQSFKNRGNPDDFDYQKYMYNSGFVGSAYLPTASWRQTGKQDRSLFTRALQFRQTVMDVFASLGFTDDEQAILSALTLGYQDSLSDDLKQGFRTTGTVHVLSVSGLHVGIIYGVITFLLGFIPRRTRYHWVKPLSAICLLWGYSFVTGLPPSVVRASTMLTMFCIAEMFNRKHSPLNNLFVAAFLMLLYNPFQFFDIGFQLSCLSVLSILVLYPMIIKELETKSKVVYFIGGLVAVSFAAQLAAFPLCLYYFGTFPTYFFITNLLIVPLVSFITYGVILVVVLWKIFAIMSLEVGFLWLPVKILQGLVEMMTGAIHFFENLPFALIENVNVSLFQLFVIYTVLINLLITIKKAETKTLKIALASLIVLLISNIHYQYADMQERYIMVRNDTQKSKIHYKEQGNLHVLDSLLMNEKNPVIEKDRYKILIVNEPINQSQNHSGRYNVTHALVMGDGYHSLAELGLLYQIDTLVLDASLKSFVRRKLTKECENRGIPIYDVTKKGAFRINF